MLGWSGIQHSNHPHDGSRLSFVFLRPAMVTLVIIVVTTTSATCPLWLISGEIEYGPYAVPTVDFYSSCL